MTSRVPWLIAGALALGALTWGFASYPLLEPDEGRNAEVAREMAARNEYVLPRLNGLPYVDKPVLYFAAGALAIEALGPTETAVRLPSLVFTLLTVVLVTWFARRLADRTAAWTAAIATAAAPFTLAYARTVIFDSALTLWVVGALVGFHEAVEGGRDGDPAGRQAWWSAGAWLAIGLGILTKGPVALALPLLVALPYAIWRRRIAAVLDPLGMLAMLALVLPWVFAVTRTVPDFLRYALFVETARRLAADGLGRTGPWWYFFPIMLGAALPWSAVVCGALARRGRGVAADRRVVFLLLWIVIPLLFFTLSQSKRPQYVLPTVPAFGLLVALLWERAGDRLPGARSGATVVALLGAVLLFAARALPGLVRAGPDVAAAIPHTARWLGAVCLLGGITAWVAASRREVVLIALTLPVAAIPVVSLPLMRAIGNERSSRALAEAVRPFVAEHAEIVAVGVYPLSLPFYLRRTLTLASADGAELTSNYIVRSHEALRHAPGGTLRPAGWWEEALVLCDRPRLFVVRPDADAIRRRLETALAFRGASRKAAIYGPCSAGEYARGP